MKQNIAVLFGGKSVEHEISIISAMQVMKALALDQYNVLPIYLTREGQWLTDESFNQLSTFKKLPVQGKLVIFDPNNNQGNLLVKTWHGPKPLKVDLVFPVLHGTYGEDGSVQGLLEMLNLPYVGCDLASSAISMDKILTKQLLQAASIPTLDYFWFHQVQWFTHKENIFSMITERFPFPLIVKPAVLGSSIGISTAKDLVELEDAIDLAVSLSERVLIEPQLCNVREINCSVLGEGEELIASECEEPIKLDTILSYQDKYAKNGKKTNSDLQNQGMAQTQRHLPAQLSTDLKKQIQAYTQAAFRVCNGSGLARIDFLLTEREEIFLCEINAMPGSLAFYLWEASNLPFTKLIEKLMQLAYNRFRRRNSLVTRYANHVFK